MSERSHVSAGAARRSQRGRRRPGLLERRWLLTAGLVLVGGWLIFVFAGAISRGGEVGRQAETVRAENAALQAQLDAARAEASFVATDAFIRQEARAYGMGEQGETSFSLKVGAPPPPSITLLGGVSDEVPGSSPLDDWLVFLFG